MNSKLKLVGVLGVVSLSGCSSQADEDSNNRIISAADYKLFDCSQLAQHASEVSAQAAALAGLNRQNCSTLVSSRTVVFWPEALTTNGPRGAEISDLKTELAAARQASLEKNCSIQFLPQAADRRAC